MHPDVDTKHGDVREEQIMVGSGGGLTAFCVGVPALIHEWLVEGRSIISRIDAVQITFREVPFFGCKRP